MSNEEAVVRTGGRGRNVRNVRYENRPGVGSVVLEVGGRHAERAAPAVRRIRTGQGLPAGMPVLKCSVEDLQLN